jgi:hypothetical protein
LGPRLRGLLLPRGFVEEADFLKLDSRGEFDSENLESDEGPARETVDELKAIVEQIRDLGIEASELEKRLHETAEAIEEASKGNLDFSFASVIEMASEGVQEGHQIVTSYLSASNAIEKTEELIREEYENKSEIHGNVFQHLILSPSLDLLRESKFCLRSGEFERIRELLEQIRTLPSEVKENCQENAEIYRYCEAISDELRKEGVATREVEDILKISRTAFLSGRFERVKELSEVIEEKAIELRERHTSAICALKRAKSAAVSLEKINVKLDEAEESLVEACVSMKEGQYEKCVEFAQKTTSLASCTCRRFRALAGKIKALKREMKRINMSGMDIPEDVREMLGRAQKELKKGNHQDSEADIELALLLLNKFEPAL